MLSLRPSTRTVELAMMIRILPLLFCAILAPAHASLPDDLGAKLGWLQGCWAAQGAERDSVEQWTSAAGKVMLGMSRTVKAGELRSFEFMQLREDQPGKLTFTAQPNGAAPTTFALLREGDGEYTFENKAHDFPQRVIYRRVGENALLARIEGLSKGALKGIDYPMKRVSCEG